MNHIQEYNRLGKKLRRSDAVPGGYHLTWKPQRLYNPSQVENVGSQRHVGVTVGAEVFCLGNQSK